MKRFTYLSQEFEMHGWHRTSMINDLFQFGMTNVCDIFHQQCSNTLNSQRGSTLWRLRRLTLKSPSSQIISILSMTLIRALYQILFSQIRLFINQKVPFAPLGDISFVNNYVILSVTKSFQSNIFPLRKYLSIVYHPTDYYCFS